MEHVQRKTEEREVNPVEVEEDSSRFKEEMRLVNVSTIPMEHVERKK